MSDRSDIRRCVLALNEIELIRGEYASSPEGGALVRRIADRLAQNPSDQGSYGGLRKQVAHAIYRGLLNEEPRS